MRRFASLSGRAAFTFGILTLGLLGALTAASLAAADGLPGVTTTLSTPTVSLPSVTNPTLPGTVTVTLPSLTGTGTTSTVDAGETTSAQVTTTASGAAGMPVARDPAAVPTGIRLPSGGLSVAASSLRPPTRLLLDRIHVSPSTIRARKQALTLTLRIRDSAGHLVRGASVSATGVPAATAKTARAFSSIFGTARLHVWATARGSRLLLVLRATGGRVQTARLLTVPVRIRR
jgi:hypothetical protein